jgi:hypothetical protein
LIEEVVLSHAKTEADALVVDPADLPATIVTGYFDKMTAGYFEDLLNGINSGTPFNPTHYFWEHLVMIAGCPFIKRDLLEKNPVHVPLLANWRRAIAASSNYPIEMIDEYLQVASRDRVF